MAVRTKITLTCAARSPSSCGKTLVNSTIISAISECAWAGKEHRACFYIKNSPSTTASQWSTLSVGPLKREFISHPGIMPSLESTSSTPSTNTFTAFGRRRTKTRKMITINNYTRIRSWSKLVRGKMVTQVPMSSWTNARSIRARI